MPIEVQREAVRGYDDAIALFGDIAPNKLKGAKLSSNIYGEYSLTWRTITLDGTKRIAASEAYGTVIHEMTHHASNLKLFDSGDVYKKALKALGLRSNSRDAGNLALRTVGVRNTKDMSNPEEIVAYAVERHMVNKKNPLVDSIITVLQQGGIIK